MSGEPGTIELVAAVRLLREQLETAVEAGRDQRIRLEPDGTRRFGRWTPR